ncbi:sensor histidine kinase [Streptomyces sp. IBSNAI002]|uniref:sensor histidine kinase n=1 Tax=Streptomyces sp. IBSNAI002 TaxID=3457500 RepID=UPI003FD5DD57
MSTFSPRHWRLAPRVTAVLALPVALAIALALLVIGHSAGRLSATTEAQRRAGVLMTATLLAHDLQNERDTLARDAGRATDELRRLRATTDTSVAAFRTAAAACAGDRQVSGLLADATAALADLRQARDGDVGTGSVAAVTAYGDIVGRLLALHVAAGRDVPGGSRPGALQSLVTGKLALSNQRAVLGAALARPETTKEQAAYLRAQQGVAQQMLSQFRSAAVPADREAYGGAADTARTDALLEAALSGTRPSRQEWAAAANQAVDGLHTAETALLDRSVREAAAERTAAYRSLVIHLSAIAVALLGTAVVAVLVARRLIGRLRQLRRSALKAAAELPVLVDRMSRASEPGRLRVDVPPVDTGVRDEIGEVERAFDEVVQEAVTQTVRQLTLRASVHETLATVSRRGDVLVQQQLELLARLQMDEADPRALEPLFTLDHLATRIRRHGESVLVLAGERVGRRHFEDALLVDVLRAAAAEVDDFTRIEITGVPEVAVAAHAVHDLTHLVAELLENATRFSEAGRPVRVGAEAADHGGGVVVRVSDSGSGIAADQLDELNVRLQAAPAIESVRGGRIGLYVVGLLAARHGARVYLDSAAGGTQVLVALPDDIVAAGPARRTGK